MAVTAATLSTDGRALLAAIAAHPDEDVPRLAEVRAGGGATEWAKAVVRAHPVTEFRVGDRKPVQARADGGIALPEWRWFRYPPPGAATSESDLPAPVFEALTGGRINEGRWCRWYETESHARTALARALANLARK